MRMPHHENPVSSTLKDHVIPLSPTRFYSPHPPFTQNDTVSVPQNVQWTRTFWPISCTTTTTPHNLKNLFFFLIKKKISKNLYIILLETNQILTNYETLSPRKIRLKNRARLIEKIKRLTSRFIKKKNLWKNISRV